MKKTLALVLAIVMALGCMSITAFAAENETNITAEITAADFGYEMVIPTTTTLTEANHENVLLGTDGKVSITNIKHPTDKVNVVYTVDLSNGNLTDGTTTINATYKYQQGANEFAAIDGTTKVTVYANKTVNDSFVNVTANADQWDAAPAGTYNASVTFNFEAIEDESTIHTVADAVATVSDHLSVTTYSGMDGIDNGCPEWTNENGFRLYEVVNLHGEGTSELGFASNVSFDIFYLSLDTALTKSGNNYTCTVEGVTYTFAFAENTLASVTVSGSSFTAANGVYNRPVLVNDILASVAIPTGESQDSAPSGAWVNQADTEAKMFVYDDGDNVRLFFFAPGAMKLCRIPLSAVLTISGENYIWNKNGVTVTFNMSGNVLQSVTLTTTMEAEEFNFEYGNILGTYTAPAAN